MWASVGRRPRQVPPVLRHTGVQDHLLDSEGIHINQHHTNQNQSIYAWNSPPQEEIRWNGIVLMFFWTGWQLALALLAKFFSRLTLDRLSTNMYAAWPTDLYWNIYHELEVHIIVNGALKTAISILKTLMCDVAVFISSTNMKFKWTILFATLADENRVSSKYIPSDVSNQRAEKALSVSFQNHAFFFTQFLNLLVR